MIGRMAVHYPDVVDEDMLLGVMLSFLRASFAGACALTLASLFFFNVPLFPQVLSAVKRASQDGRSDAALAAARLLRSRAPSLPNAFAIAKDYLPQLLQDRNAEVNYETLEFLRVAAPTLTFDQVRLLTSRFLTAAQRLPVHGILVSQVMWFMLPSYAHSVAVRFPRHGNVACRKKYYELLGVLYDTHEGFSAKAQEEGERRALETDEGELEEPMDMMTATLQHFTVYPRRLLLRFMLAGLDDESMEVKAFCIEFWNTGNR